MKCNGFFQSFGTTLSSVVAVFATAHIFATTLHSQDTCVGASTVHTILKVHTNTPHTTVCHTTHTTFLPWYTTYHMWYHIQHTHNHTHHIKRCTTPCVACFVTLRVVCSCGVHYYTMWYARCGVVWLCWCV